MNPLVDQATFDTVQERIKIKQPATWTNTDNMFRGLMICGGNLNYGGIIEKRTLQLVI